MAELEQGLEELKVVKQAFKDNISANNVSTSNVEFRNMPDLLKQMEKKLPTQTKDINPTTSSQIVTADSGYKLSQVNVGAVNPADYYKPEQSLDITPKTTAQTITPSGNSVYNRVNVSAVTSAIDKNIQPQNIKNGITILGIVGSMQATSGSPKFGELVDGSIQSVESGDLSEVNEIRDMTFINCKNLTSVLIPSNITTIGASAFEGCSSLQTLILADGVTTIGASAFKGIATTTLTIPSSVTKMESNSFADSQLTEVTMVSETPPTIEDNVFPSTTSIYVKYGAYETYKTQWSAYADKIVRLPAIPSTITVIVNNYLNELVNGATVTISGNGQAYTGTTNENGVFTQGDLQPATYTISVADLEGFKTPEPVEVVVEEDTQNSAIITYLEKSSVKPFSECTPEEISAISAEISSNNMTSQQAYETYGWSIGDTTTIPLSTGENIEMRIIGFNHDELSDGTGKAGITLEMTHCMATKYSMNATNTNAGGYETSVMRTSTLPTLKALLPEEWQIVIKPVKKNSANGGGKNYTAVRTTTEYLFLLSKIEVCGDGAYVEGGTKEGVVYEYWQGKTNEDRIKKYDADKDGVVDTNINWWLRSSPTGSDAATAGVYESTGSVVNLKSNANNGLSFAFCV